jgi:tight adherence protein C
MSVPPNIHAFADVTLVTPTLAVSPITLVGALAIMSAVPLLTWVLLSDDNAKVSKEDLLGPSSAANLRNEVLARSAKERALEPAIQAIGRKIRAVSPKGWSETVEQRLAMAGMSRTWSVERVLIIKVFTTIIGLLGAYYFIPKGGIKFIGLGLFSVIGGFYLPDTMVKNNAQKRQQRIALELPDLLDQITIGVEAGLGFDAAMQRAAKSGRGPLAEELTRSMQHMTAGLSRAEALRGLANRNRVQELRSFVGALLQAEQYGIPIAQVLRVQATDLRRRRRQRAEEKAMKLPVKVLFPLVLCILPALFVVLIGPAFLQIARNIK